MAEAPVKKSVQISAPKIRDVTFKIIGVAPLVIHRFSAKAKQGMLDKMIAGGTAKGKKNREPMDVQKVYDAARYISDKGWDGFNASSIRAAMISACRLVSFKMTLAKMSVFVVADGWDKLEPEIPLIRIIGKPRLLESVARVETGQAYITIRPCYDQWAANVHIRYDEEQFTLGDVSNLLARVGSQVGIGEGRPDSKNSCGMGWGLFEISKKK